MTSHKAPSAGQKVTTESVPRKQEGTGEVDPSSLAAESARSGGGFSANPSSGSGGSTTSESHSSKTRAPGTSGTSKSGGGSALDHQYSYGGPAPTYVNSQFRVDEKGPHGKNLKEGGFEGSGTDGKGMPEPMSEQDPSRLAEREMIGRKEGRKVARGDGGLESEQPFEAIQGDEPL
ncbi:hypothetical protein QBC47DRAFT_392631 [Echria macrotheca]|uniref:Uncharacterized protein n=1 Tax=Echria macrotheca TaxID=438768 RepID=A0AAJ0B350_9PEZI|nr:hypothetical protein QBC47DRAFT_392631 [Echria macrotheca]